MKKAIILTAVAAALAIPTGAYADVNASADCSTFVIHVGGLTAGDTVLASVGSEPPFGVTVGSGVDWQFTVDEAAGTVDASLPVQGWTSQHDFNAALTLVNADNMNGLRIYNQDVVCAAPPVAVAEPVAATADPVVPPPEVVNDPAPVELFADVTLAPPW